MKEKKITKIRDVIAKYPKGEIPKIYNERIVEIVVKLLPDIDSRVRLFDDFIRKHRIFGKSVICDENDKIQATLESRTGVILKAYVKTIIYDGNKKVAGVVERSILNDSIALRYNENNNQNSKEDS